MAGVARDDANSIAVRGLSIKDKTVIANVDTDYMISAAAFSGDGAWFVVGDSSGTITILEVDTNRTYKIGTAAPTNALDVSYYGSIIAAATSNNVMIYTWTNRNLILKSLIKCSYGGSPCVKLARDTGSVFYTVNHDRMQRANLEGIVMTTYEFFNYPIKEILFSHDGRLVVAIDSNKNVRWWDVDNPSHFGNMFVQSSDDEGLNQGYWPLTLSPGLDKFAAYRENVGVIVWEGTRPAEYIRVTEDTEKPFAIRFSDNAQELVVTYTDQHDFSQRRSLVVNIARREVVSNMFGAHGFVFSENGTRYAMIRGDKSADVFQ